MFVDLDWLLNASSLLSAPAELLVGTATRHPAGMHCPWWDDVFVSSLTINWLHIVRLRLNLEFGGLMARIQSFGDVNVKLRKSNMADGRHFENRYSSISQPRIVRIWRNLARERIYWAKRRKRDKNSEIPKCKMADGRYIENHFLSITRLHIVRLRRNLEFGSLIARTQRFGDENVKFRKSNMADGRHFENPYSSISQPRIVRIWRNLVCRRILSKATETWQKFGNSQIRDGGRTS